MRSGLLMVVIGIVMIPMGLATVAHRGIEPRISIAGSLLVVGGVLWMVLDSRRNSVSRRGFEVKATVGMTSVAKAEQQERE